MLEGLSHEQVRERYFQRGRGPDQRKAKTNNGRGRTWQVEEMWELHHEIARRLLLGQKNVVIAEELNCTAQTVSNVRNSPVVQDKLAIMKGARDAATVDIGRQIQEFAPKALKLLEDIIEGEGEEGKNASIALRAKTAERALDRAGYSPVTRSANLNVNRTIDADDLAEIKRRAAELAELNHVIDV